MPNLNAIAQLRSRMANETRRKMTPNNIFRAEKKMLLNQSRRNLMNPLSKGPILHISRRRRMTRKNRKY